jgi:hypothetical protein
MSPIRKRALAPVLVVLLLAAGMLSGCGVSSDDKPSGAASDSASPDATESATPTESGSPSPSETAQSPTAAPSPTLAPQAALLTAREMPRINDQLVWRQLRTGPVGSNPFGLCAKFDVLSIGAEQAVERSLVAGPVREHVYAGQQIATFPDSATVARAEKVLQSWHRTCSTRLPGTHRRVSPIQAVPVPTGRAWWYLVSYVPSQVPTGGGQAGGIFHAFGVVVTGNRVSMLRMEVFGQDHNYPPGQDPMQLAVKAAAGKLG